MNKNNESYIQILRQMPESLRAITIILWLGGMLAIIATLLPGELDGKHISIFKLWKTAYGPIIFVGGAISLISGFGFLKRAKWSRPILISLFAVFVLIDLFVNLIPCDCVLILILIYLFGILDMIWYFYFKQSVKNYFTTEA